MEKTAVKTKEEIKSMLKTFPRPNWVSLGEENILFAVDIFFAGGVDNAKQILSQIREKISEIIGFDGISDCPDCRLQDLFNKKANEGFCVNRSPENKETFDLLLSAIH